MAVMNFDSASSDCIRERFVEIRASDLKRIFETRRRLVREVEVTSLISAKENRAVLPHKPLLFDRIQQPSLFQKRHATRQQALTDHKAGESLFFDYEQPKTFALQQCRGKGASRACSDDEDIVICCAWVAHQR